MENMKKERRIGTFTFGCMLIVVGISVVLMTFTGTELLKYVLTLWPVAIIFLGGEILFFSFTQKDRLKIDFAGIILMCVTLFLTAVFSVGNYAVNKILYDKDVKAMIVNDFVADERNYYLSGDVTVKTDGDERVSVRFIKTPFEEEQNHVVLKVDYRVGEESIAKLIDYQNELLYNAALLNANEIYLSDLPDFVDNIYVIVYGADESALKTELL